MTKGTLDVWQQVAGKLAVSFYLWGGCDVSAHILLCPLAKIVSFLKISVLHLGGRVEKWV